MYHWFLALGAADRLRQAEDYPEGARQGRVPAHRAGVRFPIRLLALNPNFDAGLSLFVRCYADWKAMTFCSGFPIVAKLGTAHAGACAPPSLRSHLLALAHRSPNRKGFGKMKLNSQSEFEDFQSGACTTKAHYPSFLRSSFFVLFSLLW